MRRVWWWVSLSYATFGIGVENGIVVEAAPIARWTIGKPVGTVIDYYDRKGADVVNLDPEYRA